MAQTCHAIVRPYGSSPMDSRFRRNDGFKTSAPFLLSIPRKRGPSGPSIGGPIQRYGSVTMIHAFAGMTASADGRGHFDTFKVFVVRTSALDAPIRTSYVPGSTV